MTRQRSQEPLDERLDRYLAGELSAPEQRELAQAALGDPSLFDTLTDIALLKETARRVDPPVLSQAAARRWRTRRPLTFLLGGGMAAAAVIGIVMIRRPQPNAIEAQPPLTTAAPTPPLPGSRRLEAPPVFLTARVDPRGASAVFRSIDARTRLPKQAGAVLSVDGEEVEVDLGSLDGVVKGSRLRLSRRDWREPVGTFVVSTVFRERSRGQAPTGATPRTGDRVEMSRSGHVDALLQHADAVAAAADVTPARRAAELAVTQAQQSDVPSDLRRRALATLGALEHRAAALGDAARHLRLAADEFDAAPAASAVERADVLSELGSVLIEQGQYVGAERVLRLAQPSAAGHHAVRIANNLAALATLRGDFAAAAALYRTGIDLAASPELESDRRVIQNNLERLQAAR